MPEYLLNYLRCQWCGGNAGSPVHVCPPEAQAEREQHARDEVALMMRTADLEAAVERMRRDLTVPNDRATKAQLLRKLTECEAALSFTSDALAEAQDDLEQRDAEIARLRADLAQANRTITDLNQRRNQ